MQKMVKSPPGLENTTWIIDNTIPKDTLYVYGRKPLKMKTGKEKEESHYKSLIITLP